MSMMSVHIFATELHHRIEVVYLITTVSCHASYHSSDDLSTKGVFTQNNMIMSLLKVPILSSCPLTPARHLLSNANSPFPGTPK